MLKLKMPSFELPEWEPQAFKAFEASEEKLTTLRKKAGKGSDRFKSACTKLLVGVKSGKDIETLITAAIDVRAFTFLLSRSSEFYDEILIDRSLLNHLASIKNPMSRLALLQLIGGYFKHFDNVSDVHELSYWGEFIRNQLESYRKNKSSSELSRYANYSGLIFTNSGPVALARKAQENQMDFDGLLKRFGLLGYADGRYPTLCKYQYYLTTLRKIELGQDHPILQELCKHSVANSPYQDDKLLGHAVLEILIDRCAGKQISQVWQNVILGIAGDPRVPKSSDKYQKWWALLGGQRISLVRGWLSRFDLKLFLTVLEQSARDGAEEDMERMFAPRKFFMEGLLDEGVIVESRLFLSSHAEQYLKRHYKPEDLPAYAKVRGGQTPMIYLNLSNQVHMIEGSHSFKLKMLDKLPDDSVLTNYGISTVQDRRLRMGELERYLEKYPGSRGYLEQSHIDLTWQHNALEFLKKFSIKVHPGKVIRPESYRTYKSRYGL